MTCVFAADGDRAEPCRNVATSQVEMRGLWFAACETCAERCRSNGNFAIKPLPFDADPREVIS